MRNSFNRFLTSTALRSRSRWLAPTSRTWTSSFPILDRARSAFAIGRSGNVLAAEVTERELVIPSLPRAFDGSAIPPFSTWTWRRAGSRGSERRSRRRCEGSAYYR